MPWLRFTPRERTPGTHWIVGWVDPRAGLDTEVRGKILLPLPGIEPQSPGRPVHADTTDLRYPAHLSPSYWAPNKTSAVHRHASIPNFSSEEGPGQWPGVRWQKISTTCDTLFFTPKQVTGILCQLQQKQVLTGVCSVAVWMLFFSRAVIAIFVTIKSA
jgi:hypothetical protein